MSTEAVRWIMAIIAGGSLAAGIAAHEQAMPGADAAFFGICLTTVLWWANTKPKE